MYSKLDQKNTHRIVVNNNYKSRACGDTDDIDAIIRFYVGQQTLQKKSFRQYARRFRDIYNSLKIEHRYVHLNNGDEQSDISEIARKLGPYFARYQTTRKPARLPAQLIAPAVAALDDFWRGRCINDINSTWGTCDE